MDYGLGFPCHKYIMRNMDCTNEKQIAEFAKSYYSLKKDFMDDDAILAELFALGEYSKLPGKHTSPDFLHRGDITYKESSYFSSLQKDNSVRCYSCEEFAQRHLNKLHICQTCPYKYDKIHEMTLLYEKMLRSVITDTDLHLQFEIGCKKANVNVNEFFVIPYDLGDIFTTRSPHVVPVLQMIYDYYYENASSLFMMLAMDTSAPREICKVALKGISKKCTLSPMITGIPSYKDIIVDSYYEKIFLPEDKFTIAQIEEILPAMLLFSKEYLRAKAETEAELLKNKELKKKKTSGKKSSAVTKKSSKKESSSDLVSKTTSEDRSVNVTLAVSDEMELYQELCLDFLDEESLDEELNDVTLEPTVDVVMTEPVMKADEPVISDENISSQEEPNFPVLFTKESISLSDDDTNAATSKSSFSLKSEICPMPVISQLPSLESYCLDKKFRFRKGNPIFCEVVYVETEQKEYLIFGNMASRHSHVYQISQDDVDTEAVQSLFGDPRYQFVTYNGYSFVRFLKECGVVPGCYTCLNDVFYYVTHGHSSFREELTNLSGQPFIDDILNILSLYKESYHRHLMYLKKQDLRKEYSFFEERQHTLNLSHASYIMCMDTERTNKNYLRCDTISPNELYFTKYIPKPFSGKGYYCLFSVAGLTSKKKVSCFEEKILSLLYYKKYMMAYDLILLYMENGEFIFYCDSQNGPGFISHMEAEILEVGRELCQNILLEQKVVTL